MPRLTKLSRSVRGLVAVVTGAASGMGRATAQLLVDEGARVALMDIDGDGLESLAEGIRGVGGEALVIPVDLADRQAVGAAIAEVVEHFGALDILINNAGFARPVAVEAQEFPVTWDATFSVLIEAQAWAIRAALPALRRSECPRVVNVASTEAFGATRFNSPYVAAKHASLGLTRAMAVELGKEGITVNCVCPGPVRTGITAAIPEEDKQTFAARRTALRRYAEPEEVAHAVLNLVLPSSSFITGAALVVDGGLTVRNA